MPDFATQIVTKMREGTTRGDVHLCESCRSFAKRRGNIPAGDAMRCNSFRKSITCKIAECSEYYPSNLPASYEYEEQAWILARNKKDEPVFIRPKVDRFADEVYNEDRDEGAEAHDE